MSVLSEQKIYLGNQSLSLENVQLNFFLVNFSLLVWNLVLNRFKQKKFKSKDQLSYQKKQRYSKPARSSTAYFQYSNDWQHTHKKQNPLRKKKIIKSPDTSHIHNLRIFGLFFPCFYLFNPKVTILYIFSIFARCTYRNVKSALHLHTV